jgi:hypothetical protein
VAGIDQTVVSFKNAELDYQSRWRVGEGAMQVYADYPLTGVGAGNFRYAYPKFQDPERKRQTLVYAHNDWKQLLSETGTAGLVLLIAGLGIFLVLLIRRWWARSNPFSVCLGAVPLAALAAMAVHAWSDFNLRIPANFMMFTAMLAIGFCALYLEEGRRLDRVAPRVFVIDLPRGALALAVVLAGVLWAGVWSVRHLAAESHCPPPSTPTLRLNFQPALADIRRAILWDDANAAYAYKEGMLLIREMDEENRRWIDCPGDPREKAQARDPLQRRIVAALEAAVRRNPLNAEYHVRLGWEYTHLWYRPDYAKKWLAASDTSMERAAHVGGGWAENPHLHLELGNYWIMRSRSLPPGDLRTEAAWTRAWWHYRQSLALDSGKASRQEIAGFVNSFYPGQTGELDRILKEVAP